MNRFGAAVCAAWLWGCGPTGEESPPEPPALGRQPLHYRVALDVGPGDPTRLPTTCFDSPYTSSGQRNSTTFLANQVWNVTFAEGGTSYLEMGSQTFGLGDSTDVIVTGPLGGAGNVFSASVFQQVTPTTANGFTDSLDIQSITVTFSDLGPSPIGRVELSAKFRTNQRDSVRPVECFARLPFRAARYQP